MSCFVVPVRVVRALTAVVWVAALAALAACGGGGGSSNNPAATAQGGGMSAQAQLGALVFNDQTLSVGGNQSCATCHVPELGHAGAPNSIAEGLGSDATELGSDGHSLGRRVAPSLRYLKANLRNGFDFVKDPESGELTPTGGFFLDGRVDTLAAQAKEPFLNPIEMGNPDKASVVAKLALRPYADQFKAQFGQNIFNDPEAAFNAIAQTLELFQRESPDFAPYSSKYDAFLRGQASLSTSELRGLAWFNSPSKGNCRACHPSGIDPTTGAFPLFTDFTYDTLGVPRNYRVSGSYGDKGLCDSGNAKVNAFSGKESLCGAFKVPSLRNVGLRKAFFHNGRFRNLTDVVTFYVQRDTNPEKWYVDANGVPEGKFNDLPDYAGNVNTTEVPYNRHPGEAPALNADEIDEVVSFLCTLTDGWTGASQPCRR
ncbi:MAG: cytochrome c peroxidase [Aquabacterium sp.]